MSSKALVGSMLLAALSLAAGYLTLDEYLRTGEIYISKWNTRLTGRGALTIPLSLLGAGVAMTTCSLVGYRRASRAANRHR